MLELFGRLLGSKGFPVGRIERIADEGTQNGMHSVLHVERDGSLDAVGSLALTHRFEEALKKTPPQRLSRLVGDREFQLPLDVGLQDVWELAVIPDENDPALRQCHRNEQIEGIGEGIE